MTLPKQLQADSEYGDEIRNDAGNLAIQVYGNPDSPETRELRDEIIVRWNSYETLRDTLSACHKLLDENT